MKYEWDWRLPYQDQSIGRWLELLPRQVCSVWQEQCHGDLPRWRAALEALPKVKASAVDFSQARIVLGLHSDCNDETRNQIRQSLIKLHPWRKGPYRICGLSVDTEWRSDMKWDRLKAHIQPLRRRHVLDVGCGNGYHLWRMLGEGAELVIGIDPTQLFAMQFEAVKYFTDKHYPVHLFPLGIEALPAELNAFDTVFSMGVFYHRQSPFGHLIELKGALRNGGELVLETLVIEGDAGEVLVPEKRYAKMRNVWFIPTPGTLILWLKRAGFSNVRLVDVSTTCFDEQRTTEWMRFESLKDFLNPKNPRRTIEGYPAPHRAIILAKKNGG
jgi:tRNA (mo5U34)-methyltransferase